MKKTNNDGNVENNQMILSDRLCFEYTFINDETDSRESLQALNDVSVNVRKGEFIAILGHNGSGKSTLAKHINALLIPTSGTMWIKGMDSRQDESLWDIRQSAGMVFQNPDNQIIATIVEEDVAFGPENLGVEPKEIRRRVDESLAFTGMSDYAKNPPHFLSGGQKQRVAIAGVLAMKPDCIVLDEPTSMLDPIGRKEVMETVSALNKNENITVILITHYMEEAVLADRVIVMEAGEIVMDDIPANVFRQVDRLKELSLDVPQMTALSHKLIELGLPLPDDIMTVEDMAAAILNLNRIEDDLCR